jgi:hypothetical protein
MGRRVPASRCQRGAAKLLERRRRRPFLGPCFGLVWVFEKMHGQTDERSNRHQGEHNSGNDS